MLIVKMKIKTDSIVVVETAYNYDVRMPTFRVMFPW